MTKLEDATNRVCCSRVTVVAEQGAYLMSALLQFWQLEAEAHALLYTGLLQVGCHVHVNLTQPVNDVVRRVTACRHISYPDAINIQHNLHQHVSVSSAPLLAALHLTSGQQSMSLDVHASCYPEPA